MYADVRMLLAESGMRGCSIQNQRLLKNAAARVIPDFVQAEGFSQRNVSAGRAVAISRAAFVSKSLGGTNLL